MCVNCPDEFFFPPGKGHKTQPTFEKQSKRFQTFHFIEVFQNLIYFHMVSLSEKIGAA